MIARGRDKHASVLDRQKAKTAQQHLWSAIEPYFLRREKTQVFTIRTQDGANQSSLDTTQELGYKTDIILWISLTNQQKDLYKAFLETDQVKLVCTI